MMDERFLLIEIFPGYRVSRDGVVQSRWSRTVYKTFTEIWLPLKPIRRGRFLSVNLGMGDKKVARTIHRLVLEAFVGPCAPGLICCHNDGDPTNNRVENLRWDTYQSNSDDMLLHGTRLMGSQINAKLNEDDVMVIRKLKSEGVSFVDLSQAFGVTRQNIEFIVHRRSWKQLP